MQLVPSLHHAPLQAAPARGSLRGLSPPPPPPARRSGRLAPGCPPPCCRVAELAPAPGLRAALGRRGERAGSSRRDRSRRRRRGRGAPAPASGALDGVSPADQDPSLPGEEQDRAPLRGEAGSPRPPALPCPAPRRAPAPLRRAPQPGSPCAVWRRGRRGRCRSQPSPGTRPGGREPEGCCWPGSPPSGLGCPTKNSVAGGSPGGFIRRRVLGNLPSAPGFAWCYGEAPAWVWRCTDVHILLFLCMSCEYLEFKRVLEQSCLLAFHRPVSHTIFNLNAHTLFYSGSVIPRHESPFLAIQLALSQARYIRDLFYSAL